MNYKDVKSLEIYMVINMAISKYFKAFRQSIDSQRIDEKNQVTSYFRTGIGVLF